MHRTRFQKHYLKKHDYNKRKYTKQWYYSVSLRRKSKKEYCGSLKVKKVFLINKTFF